MGTLGNKTFQGTGLSNDVIRRLDDMLRALSSQSTSIGALEANSLTRQQADSLYGERAVQSILSTPGTVLNITNATGVSATPQPILNGTHSQRASYSAAAYAQVS